MCEPCKSVTRINILVKSLSLVYTKDVASGGIKHLLLLVFSVPKLP